MILRFLRRINRKIVFRGSRQFWESRYASGGTSGNYERQPQFKSEFINSFIREHDIHSVIDFGCGDGEITSLIPCQSYTGIDVSETAIALCRKRFRDDQRRQFFLNTSNISAELTLSLDVIYHLVENKIFEAYMSRLFSSAEKFVIIYSTDIDKNHDYPHIRERRFSDWVRVFCPGWKLREKIKNRYPREGSLSSDFFIYEKEKL